MIISTDLHVLPLYIYFDNGQIHGEIYMPEKRDGKAVFPDEIDLVQQFISRTGQRNVSIDYGTSCIYRHSLTFSERDVRLSHQQKMNKFTGRRMQFGFDIVNLKEFDPKESRDDHFVEIEPKSGAWWPSISASYICTHLLIDPIVDETKMWKHGDVCYSYEAWKARIGITDLGSSFHSMLRKERAYLVLACNDEEIVKRHFRQKGGLEDRTALFTPEYYQELTRIVRRLFGEELADLTLLRQGKNLTHHLLLKDGSRAVLKEFQDPENIKTEAYFLELLATAGLAPHARREGCFLFSKYFPSTPLSELPAEDTSLAHYYDAAIDILVALGRRASQAAGLSVRPADPAFYYRTFGQNYDGRTSQTAVIPADFFPYHILTHKGKVNVVDLEHVILAPVEIALATLLCSIHHNLSDDFIRERLNHYCQVQDNVDKRLLEEAFAEQMQLIQTRIERMIPPLERRGDLESAALARETLLTDPRRRIVLA